MKKNRFNKDNKKNVSSDVNNVVSQILSNDNEIDFEILHFSSKTNDDLKFIYVLNINIDEKMMWTLKNLIYLKHFANLIAQKYEMKIDRENKLDSKKMNLIMNFWKMSESIDDMMLSI